MTLAERMVPYLGKWKMVENENLDEYLKTIGIISSSFISSFLPLSSCTVKYIYSHLCIDDHRRRMGGS